MGYAQGQRMLEPRTGNQQVAGSMLLLSHFFILPHIYWHIFIATLLLVLRVPVIGYRLLRPQPMTYNLYTSEHLSLELPFLNLYES